MASIISFLSTETFEGFLSPTAISLQVLSDGIDHLRWCLEPAISASLSSQSRTFLAGHSVPMTCLTTMPPALLLPLNRLSHCWSCTFCISAWCQRDLLHGTWEILWGWEVSPSWTCIVIPEKKVWLDNLPIKLMPVLKLDFWCWQSWCLREQGIKSYTLALLMETSRHIAN